MSPSNLVESTKFSLRHTHTMSDGTRQYISLYPSPSDLDDIPIPQSDHLWQLRNSSDLSSGNSSRDVHIAVSHRESKGARDRDEWTRPGVASYGFHHSAKQQQTPTMIQVTPQLELPLHGSEETLRAMQEGAIQSGECASCNSRNVCVSNASFVLCPICRVISPLGKEGGGVGLGLLRDEYLAWELEHRQEQCRVLRC